MGRRPVVPLETREDIIRRWACGESSGALGREFGLHENYARNMAIRAGVERVWTRPETSARQPAPITLARLSR